MISLIGDDFKKAENYSYNFGNKYRQINYESRHEIEGYLAYLLLNAELSYAKQTLEQLLNPIINELPVFNREKDDYSEFIGTILDYIMCVLYDNGNVQPEPINYKKQLSNFWEIWEHFFILINNSSQKLLISKLLLHNQYLMFDTTGKVHETTWRALEGHFNFYARMVKSLGRNYTPIIINVLSTIGRDAFLPYGICLLKENIENNSLEQRHLVSDSSERLIRELFYNHIQKIKSNKMLIDDYIWILNCMVDLGSSEAYRFRENVITYKVNN
jgi:hypothetical protein